MKKKTSKKAKVKKIVEEKPVREKCCSRKNGGFFGILLIVIGIVYLFKSFGLFDSFSLAWFGVIWPIGLIIAGVAFLSKQRLVGHFFLILTIVLGIMYISADTDIGEQRSFNQIIDLKDDVGMVSMELNFGAGDVSVKAGSPNSIYYNEIISSDLEEPSLEYEVSGNTANIEISRNTPSYFWKGGHENWDITLSPLVEYDFDLNFGAADMDMDLQSLRVNSLNIESGATDIFVKFGSYPTNVNVETGASSVEFEFPTDMNVMVIFDGGASSVDLDHFDKINGVYYSPEFDSESSDLITVNIEAGASSIDGHLYTVDKVVEDNKPAIQLEIVRSDNSSNVSIEEE